MKQGLYTTEQINTMLGEGSVLLLAGAEEQLQQVQAGNWIGGTIPYFMTPEGGLFTQNRIFATVLPDFVESTDIREYTKETIHTIYSDLPEQGLALTIIPAGCDTLLTYALQAPRFKQFALKPCAGWIAGVNLADLGSATPKVFNGATGDVLEDGAMVMQVILPTDYRADIGIINIFEQGDGDTITFPFDGFAAEEAFINGSSQNFAAYMQDNNIDIKLPLVADLYGAAINTSIQLVNYPEGRVHFYAPVFKDVEYKLAKPVGDYVKTFSACLPDGATENMAFSCNCILNYLYSELEGKTTANFTGPFTFGEIAYQLLNQTLVYCRFVKTG